MKTVFYLNGNKITRKAFKELVGDERLKRILSESKEIFFEEPGIALDWMVKGGTLSVEFC